MHIFTLLLSPPIYGVHLSMFQSLSECDVHTCTITHTAFESWKPAVPSVYRSTWRIRPSERSELAANLSLRHRCIVSVKCLQAFWWVYCDTIWFSSVAVALWESVPSMGSWGFRARAVLTPPKISHLFLHHPIILAGWLNVCCTADWYICIWSVDIGYPGIGSEESVYAACDYWPRPDIDIPTIPSLIQRHIVPLVCAKHYWCVVFEFMWVFLSHIV
jgi:hypothetical protein